MGWILMQQSDEKESSQVVKLIIKNGECKSDLTKNGARLQHIDFVSSAFTYMECKFHSLMGKVVSGRCGIGQY